MPEVQNHEVSAAEAGQKVLQFLERQVGGVVPRGALMRWIRTGQVRVDGGRVKPFDRIEAGQVVRIPPYGAPARAEADAQATRAEGPGLTFVHEDAGLLVVAKPSGLPTQLGSGWTDSVATRLKRYGRDGFEPVPTHRLDRDTSGLLLAARTFGELRRLTELFRDGKVGKTYLAWVWGRLQPGRKLAMRDNLSKTGQAGAERVTAGQGKEAVAEAYPVLVRGNATLVAVRLLTGRTHQIRVQLATRGHPLVGDRKYGKPDNAPGLLLHSWRLVLPERTFELLPSWPDPWSVSPEDVAEAVGNLL